MNDEEREQEEIKQYIQEWQDIWYGRSSKNEEYIHQQSDDKKCDSQ